MTLLESAYRHLDKALNLASFTANVFQSFQSVCELWNIMRHFVAFTASYRDGNFSSCLRKCMHLAGFALTWKAKKLDLVRERQGILLVVRENFIHYPCFSAVVL